MHCSSPPRPLNFEVPRAELLLVPILTELRRYLGFRECTGGPIEWNGEPANYFKTWDGWVELCGSEQDGPIARPTSAFGIWRGEDTILFYLRNEVELEWHILAKARGLDGVQIANALSWDQSALSIFQITSYQP